MCTIRPVIRAVEPVEIEAILARNQVGRLAYLGDRHVDIEPVHYVFHEGWIYGRTSPGTKLRSTGTTWAPVAFEVDEVEALFRWRSVVVRGGFYTVDPEGAAWERDEWRHGVELLRSLIPETFTERDPVPHRTVLFRIAAQERTGREATEGGVAP